MPPIYLGDTPVTVYKGETQINTVRVGETVVEVYTTTTTTVPPTTTTTTTTTVPPTTTPAPASSIEIIDSGNYGWSGTGTVADPYVTTYFSTFYNDEAIRGGSPGNWTSSNRPAWQVSGSGTFNYTITGMRSGDDWADHHLYKSTDGGSSWTLAHDFNWNNRFSPIAAMILVNDGDIIEQRGNGSSYISDTWVLNPTLWLS